MDPQVDDRPLVDEASERYWYERYHAHKVGTDWFEAELDRLVKAGRIVLVELESEPKPFNEPPF